MSFDELVISLSARLAKPLPGSKAHEPMRAVFTGAVRPNFEHKVPPKPGSVLILLYQEDDVIKFPLIKRTEYPGAHSGQVSFPGGKAELNEDAYQTALREGEEEIGVKQADIKVLGRLSDFFVIPSNFMVAPIVACIDYPPVFRPDQHEVVRILSGSLDDLVKDDAIHQKEIVAAGKFQLMAPHFEIEGEVVWGATAMMLNEFRMILRETI